MKFMPSCQEVQSNLTEYVEGSLPLRQRLGVWIHLLACRVCAGLLRGLRALPGVAKASLAPPPEAPEEAARVLADVLASFRKT